MKISFVVAVYNIPPQWITECVQSLTNQKGNWDYEIILVDDGSKPEVAAHCDAVMAGVANGLVLHQANQGVSVARNTGSAAATGDYILFVDGDDWVETDYLETLVPVLTETPYDILCYGHWDDYGTHAVEHVFGDREKFSFLPEEKEGMIASLQNVPEFMEKYPMFFGAQWPMVYSRKMVVERSLRNVPGLTKSQDMVYVLDAVDAARSVGYVRKALYHYRSNPNGTVQSYKKNVGYYLKLVEANRDFVLRTGMDPRRVQGYCWFALISFESVMRLHFCHEKNPQSFAQRQKAFREMMETEIMQNLFREIDTSKLTRAKKYQLLCMKNHWLAGLMALDFAKRHFKKNA